MKHSGVRNGCNGADRTSAVWAVQEHPGALGKQPAVGMFFWKFGWSYSCSLGFSPSFFQKRNYLDFFFVSYREDLSLFNAWFLPLEIL